MIRICQVVGNMNGGGVESVIMNYYRHVDRDKVQFDFIVTENSALVPRREMESLGGRVFIVPPYTDLLRFQRACYALFSEHREWKIVHAHMNALNVFPLREAKHAGVPVRISHSHSTSGSGEVVKNIAKFLLKPMANIYPTERFACGEYAGQWLFGYKYPFTIMRNAIDLQKFAFSSEKRSLAREEFGVDERTFVVGHLGRFMEQKNHAFLLDVFASLLSMKPNSLLVLAGTGPLLDAMKKKAVNLGISDQVLFLGQRDDADVLYCGFDALCMPSLYEGLPVVGVEAQVSGLPFLISDQVTDEVIITSRSEKLQLDSEPKKWAKRLASIADDDREEPLSSADLQALSAFDISKQGVWLSEKYLNLAKGAGIAEQ
jgi:glycosyltransferase involved in cell wall biosynthesis